jgi:cyclase
MTATVTAQREVELADGVVGLVHGDGTMGIANAAVLLADRPVVVDTMLLPEMAAGLHDLLRRRGRSAGLVLNTHHHADHVGGNVAFPGVRKVAHPRTARIVAGMAAPGFPATLRTLIPRFADRLADWPVEVPEPVEPGGIQELLPDAAELLVFTDAHSPADLAIWLPAESVLLAGDLCFTGVTPLAVHGRISGWCAALDRLIALRPRVVLPGHGEPAGPGALTDLRGYLGQVWQAAGQAVAAGADARDALADVDTGDRLEAARTLLNLQVAMTELTARTN